MQRPFVELFDALPDRFPELHPSRESQCPNRLRPSFDLSFRDGFKDLLNAHPNVGCQGLIASRDEQSRRLEGPGRGTLPGRPLKNSGANDLKGLDKAVQPKPGPHRAHPCLKLERERES